MYLFCYLVLKLPSSWAEKNWVSESYEKEAQPNTVSPDWGEGQKERQENEYLIVVIQ